MRFVERLKREHDRSGFDCGVPPVDKWFRELAGQAEMRHGSARVRVLVDEAIGGETIPIAFYALAGHALAFDDAPPGIAKGQPRYNPVPAVRLAQLGVDTRYQRQGIGGAILADVLREVIRADEHLALPVLVVDAIDDATVGWYERFGFTRLVGHPLRLALRLQDARATFDI